MQASGCSWPARDEEGSMTEPVKLVLNEGVAHVRLNRPEKKNALDAGMFDGLLAAAHSLRDDMSVRAVVLSGEGDSFSSGLDVSSLGETHGRQEPGGSRDGETPAASSPVRGSRLAAMVNRIALI